MCDDMRAFITMGVRILRDLWGPGIPQCMDIFNKGCNRGTPHNTHCYVVALDNFRNIV